MFEGNYQLEIQVEANTSMIQRGNERRVRDPRPKQPGPVWDVIAGFGSLLVRLGTSLERLAPVDETIHADV